MAWESATAQAHFPTGERKHECRDRHADCCKDAHDGNALLTEECANAPSQRSVFMKEPSDGLTISVNLGPESCFVREEGFELRLFFKFEVGELALKPFHSISNILLNFGVVRFGQFPTLPGQVLLDFGSHSRHGLPHPSQISCGLGDPGHVNLRIINGLQCGFDISCSLNDVVGRAGEVLQLDGVNIFREGFLRTQEGPTASWPSPRDTPDL